MAVDVDVTKESVAVFLDASNDEHLIYRVTVKGAKPIFALVDSQTQQLLLSSKNPPDATMPAVVFERQWPLSSDQTQLATSHTMGFQFLAAISYRYEVELIRADGTSESVMDITYKSTEPEDAFFQDLQITTV